VSSTTEHVRSVSSGSTRSSAAPQRPTSVRLASMPRRIAGAAIDAMLIMVVVGIIAPLFRGSTGVVQIRIDAVTGEQVMLNPHAGLFDIAAALPFLVTAGYVIVLIALWGRTLGGWAVGIRCLNAETGGRPGWAVASKRWLVLFGLAGVLAVVPIIGTWAWILPIVIGLSPLWDPSGWLRGYHDRFAGDIVVRS